MKESCKTQQVPGRRADETGIKVRVTSTGPTEGLADAKTLKGRKAGNHRVRD